MERQQKRRRRPRPVGPQARLLGVGLTVTISAALAGTACGLLSRQPAPAPLQQQASWGRSSVVMTALQPERPHTQQLQQAVGGGWSQPLQPAAPALQRPLPTQPAIELQSPFVDVAIRPATAEEIPLVVGLRHEVFSAGAGPETAEEVAEWKARSLDNLLNRRAKGAVLLVATARDRRWGPGAAPLLVGSVEYSYHEFKETGFSPILSGDFYCEEAGGEEDEEHCFLFEEEEEEEEWGGSWRDTTAGAARRAPAAFRRPASSSRERGGQQGVGAGVYVTGVMVADCCRRQGLGLSLLRAVEHAQAALRTPSYVCMFVEAGNAPALALYTQKAGYNLVPYSPTAEAFAGKIGLYKGPYAARQYSFVYKRLELLEDGDGSGSSSGSDGRVLPDAHAAAPRLPFPGRMPALRSPLFS